MPKHKKRSRDDSEDESSSSSSEDDRKKSSKRRHSSDSEDDKKKKKKKKSSKKKQRERSRSEDPDDSKSKKKESARVSSGGGGGGKSWKPVESETERAARKAAKEAKKIAAVFGYSNHSNPFGDSDLFQQFQWRKKDMKDGKSSKSKEQDGQKQLRLVQEISKVRERRDQHEREVEEMERLKDEEARLREAAMYEEQEKREEEFHLEQARTRSKIRLVEGRGKPIDLMAKNILLFGDDPEERGAVKYKGKSMLDLSALEAELREPYLIFQDLTIEELKDLQHDIREYQGLEGEGSNKQFWNSLALVCKDELKRAGLAASGPASVGVHSAVTAELDEMFEGKSIKELEHLRSQIQKKVDNNDGTVDVDYWENVLEELKVYFAKAMLRDIHKQMLEVQLRRLDERKAEISRRKFERRQRGEPSDDEEEEQLKRVVPAPEVAGPGYDDSNQAMAMVNAERTKGLGDGEGTLGTTDEVDVDKVYSWLDKYRPRKPRYFNRVKTGWDWNKYNQTHYDHDNPPPKTIQGYKFNIFYPDLIDKTKAPTFRIEPADSPDFCIIRFSAGPPYEDVAFKIFNREWERSHKRGFKCLFERGILHLYFNFKFIRYRR